MTGLVTLFFCLSTAAGLESSIPVLKDGSVGPDFQNGASKVLAISDENNALAWATFSTEHYNVSGIEQAWLCLYIEDVTSNGDLTVTLLKESPKTTEYNTTIADLSLEDGNMATKALTTTNAESIIFIDITSQLKSGNFYGVALAAESGSSLECAVSSKEGAFSPYILLNTTLPSFSIADESLGSEKLASEAVTSDKIKNGAIGESKISADAIDSSKIKNNSISSSDIKSIGFDKVTGKPSEYTPSSHDHASEVLNPLALAVGPNSPTFQMMTWDVTLNTSSTSITLTEEQKCPNPSGILAIFGGVQFSSKIWIPMGYSSNEAAEGAVDPEFFSVQFYADVGEQKLNFKIGSDLDGKVAKIVCFFVQP